MNSSAHPCHLPYSAITEQISAAVVAAAETSPRPVLVDAFAGTGSNVISFALANKWDTIYAIEADLDTIICGMHNSVVYGVAEKITWIHGDSFAVLASGRLNLDPASTVIFASPPWGGECFLEVFHFLKNAVRANSDTDRTVI